MGFKKKKFNTVVVPLPFRDIFILFFSVFHFDTTNNFFENSYTIRVILHYLDTLVHHQALGQEAAKKIKIKI